MRAQSKTRALVLSALLLVAVLGLYSLRSLGRWLVIADPLQKAQAIVVFGGHLPFRAMEAAELYRDGWAPQVWLTRGAIHVEDEALSRLGIDREPEDFYNHQVLLRLGVPDKAIRTLPERVLNTEEEVQVVSMEMGSDPRPIIVITSKYHTRRVKTIWKAISGAKTAIVRYTNDDPFNAARWWGNTTDAMAVSREAFGILNVWAGFPVKSAR